MADEDDAFPNDPSETLDTDGDGMAITLIGTMMVMVSDLAGALFEAGIAILCQHLSWT